MVIIDGAIELVDGVLDGRKLVVVAHHFIDSLFDIIVDVELVIGDLLAINLKDAGRSGFGADWTTDTSWVDKEITTTANL